MGRPTIIILAAFLPVFVFGQETPGQQDANVLDDIVIQETYEAGFEEEKPALSLNFDFSDVVSIKERASWTSVDQTEEIAKQVRPDLRLSHPELANIPPAPVKVFHITMANIGRWEFNITASDGSLFRTISGEGNPPQQLGWDGRSDQGLPLVPGHRYAYSMTAVDKAGNRGTFPGQSFTIPAFYLQNEETFLIGLAGSEIFSADGLGLTPDAEKYAREVATLIRYFTTQARVTVCGHNRYLGQFLELVRSELIVEEGYFQKIKGSRTNSESILFEIN